MIIELHGDPSWEGYQNTRYVKSLNWQTDFEESWVERSQQLSSKTLYLKIDIIIAVFGGRARTQNQHFWLLNLLSLEKNFGFSLSPLFLFIGYIYLKPQFRHPFYLEICKDPPCLGLDAFHMCPFLYSSSSLHYWLLKILNLNSLLSFPLVLFIFPFIEPGLVLGTWNLIIYWNVHRLNDLNVHKYNY